MLHIKIRRMADIVESRVNTAITLGIIKSRAAPQNIHNPDSRSPRSGILSDESFPRARGAEFSLARPNNIRLVEKTPLFAEERADVSTTKFTTAAAAGKPAREKSPTNGLLSGEIWCHEETEIMHTSDNT